MIRDVLSCTDYRTLSLYIHIPFCLKKCFYCDFFSLTDVSAMELYIDTLIEEMSLLKSINTSWESVYIGGGTPNLLPEYLLKKLLSSVADVAGDSREQTIECNPEFINRKQIKLFSDYGINRLSVGVQSLDDGFLELIGRTTKRKSVEAAFSVIERYWENNISVDILANRPISHIYGVINDMDFFIKMGVPHISVYGLTVEKDTPLYSMVIDENIIFDEEYASQEWFDISSYLVDKGYNHYEISNFCIPGNESIHNMRYWQMEPYLGLGASAVSTLKDKEGRIIRVSGKRSVSDYCAENNSFYNIDIIDNRDFLFEFFMMGLRTAHGIDIERFKSIWGYSPDFFIKNMIDQAVKQKKIITDSGKLFLSFDARAVLNKILLDILSCIDSFDVIPIPRWP
ncbi:radical SAM family heme chaperone HemW [Spirochaetia bacterium 38H-sp]|uniref:Heme chaperone HemW n=1 Tax=Rarispira pelagica TaxID=3141764 RepID=A0ABU9UBE3_9SPIR